MTGRYKRNLADIIIVFAVVTGLVTAALTPVVGATTPVEAQTSTETPNGKIESQTTESVTDSVAASNVDTSIEIDSDFQPENIIWQGQIAVVSGFKAGEEVMLRRVAQRNDQGRPISSFFVEQYSANASGAVLVDTSDLSQADYYLASMHSETEGTADFRLVEQRSDIKFSKSYVRSEGDTLRTLMVTSNRSGAFAVNVTERHLTDGELLDIFDSTSVGAVNADIDGDGLVNDDDGIRLQTVRNDFDPAPTVNFTGQDIGEYDFEFDVADTTAVSTDSIRVFPPDSNYIFEAPPYESSAGDVAEITVEMAETSEGYLFIGDGNQRYVQRLRVSDGNGDGEVVIAFNTRYAGLADSEIPTDKSIFEIADQPGVENSSKDAVSVRPLDSQTLNQLGVNETLAQPIQPNQSATSYPLATAPTGSISVKQGELIIRDRKVTTQLRLVDPSLKNARLMVAPRARADADDLTPLLTEIATPLASDDSLNSAGQLIFDGGQIALNERIVFQANLTGVFGTIQEGDDFGQTQDLSLSIVQTNPGPNRSAITIIPTDAGTNLFVDPDNNTIAFVVDTWRVDVSDDQNVPTLEEILTDSIANNEDFQIVLSIGSSNPYFEGGGIVANFTFVERRASFDNTTEVIEDGRPVDYLLLNSSRVRISGTATVAPGTELTVRAEEQTGGSGVPLFKQNTTVVQPGGTWATVLTFEDISNGTDFFLTVRDEQATRLRQIRGLIGIDIGNETDAPRVVPDGEPTTNVDDDPQHEDIDGDESFTIFDVSAFLAHYGDPAVQNNSELFNFDGQGGVDIFDVAALLEEV